MSKAHAGVHACELSLAAAEASTAVDRFLAPTTGIGRDDGLVDMKVRLGRPHAEARWLVAAGCTLVVAVAVVAAWIAPTPADAGWPVSPAPARRWSSRGDGTSGRTAGWPADRPLRSAGRRATAYDRRCRGRLRLRPPARNR